MGATYAVAPLDEEARKWLHEQRIAFPDAPARWPTPKELRSVLESFGGCSLSYRNTAEGWDAQLVDPRPDGGWMADLWVGPVTNEDTPARFSFHKPTLDFALQILERVCHACGPFLMMDGSSGRAVVVTPGADVPGLIEELQR